MGEKITPRTPPRLIYRIAAEVSRRHGIGEEEALEITRRVWQVGRSASLSQLRPGEWNLMSLGKKCDVCRRTIEKLVDGKRLTPFISSGVIRN